MAVRPVPVLKSRGKLQHCIKLVSWFNSYVLLCSRESMIRILVEFIFHLWMKEKCKCGVGSVASFYSNEGLKSISGLA